MLPLSPEDLHKVTAQVGFALWQIQVLELAVGGYLVRVHKITPAVAKAQAQAMFARAGKSTLGQLLRELNATGNAPQHLTEALDASSRSAIGWFIIAGMKHTRRCTLRVAEPLWSRELTRLPMKLLF